MSTDVEAPEAQPESQPQAQADETANNVQPSLSVEPVSRTRNLAHRTSAYSQSRSRQTSAVFPLFHSSLPYALVRDFAYPPYNPMHYGPMDETARPLSASGDFDSSRRQTGLDDSDEDMLGSSRRLSRHRKSKSYTNLEDHARGRRRSEREAAKSSYGGGNYVMRESQSNRGPGYDISIMGDMKHPPFREDSDSVPYSPSALEDHRPESASLDESFAGPSLALYDFAPENDNELELREGQVIQVGYRHGQGWLVAMNLETGEQGLVPEEYVRLIRDIEGGWDGQGQDQPGLDDSIAEEDTETETEAEDHPPTIAKEGLTESPVDQQR